MRDIERRMEKKQREAEQSQRQQGALNAANISHKSNIRKRNTKIAEIVEQWTFTGKKKVLYSPNC